MHNISTIELKKQFKTKNGVLKVIDNFSCNIENNEFIAVHGPSGCGKSTLLLMLGGLLKPTDGIVKVNGTNHYNLNKNELGNFRAKNIGFVFQQFHLIPYLNILENILVSNIAMPHKNIKNEAMALLEKFQIEHRVHHLPSELSVGEQQRVAMARALIHSPSIILADEPTGNLDPNNSKIILDMLKEFAQSNGIVVMVSHDKEAIKAASRTINLQS